MMISINNDSKNASFGEAEQKGETKWALRTNLMRSKIRLKIR